MSTFAYEYYKRNRATLIIGKKSEDKRPCLKQIGYRNGVKVYTSEDSDEPDTISCFYETTPKFSLQSGFSGESSELLQAITTVKNMWDAGKKAWKNGGSDAVAGVGDALLKFDLGKAGEEFLGGIADALKNGYEISAIPTIMRWGGQQPISFDIKLIFLDKDGGPVYFDDRIQTLLALATCDLSDSGWTLKGPLGFNGTVSKVSQIGNFLGDKIDPETRHDLGLHSLILYKGDGEKKVKVLDLYKILIVQDIKLTMSEQLYVKPTIVTEIPNIAKGSQTWKKFPAYKWITADVKFSTVCPLPSPLSIYRTNVSNLYGLREQ